MTVTPAMQARWDAHSALLQSLASWDLRGSVAVNSEQENWDARLSWRQQGDTYQLRFLAPLGQGAAILEGNADSVTIRAADGSTRSAADPETLLRETTGVTLPLQGLRYWIRGLPAPDSIPRRQQLDAAGRLAELEQNGWQIEYARYLETNSPALPAKLVLRNGDYRIKIVVSAWERL
jgi:outer membrane lipoprotein LolB